MSTMWVVIGVAVIGAWLCARSRAAMPAMFFGVLAVVLFLYTSTGQDVMSMFIHLHVSAAAPAGAR